MVQVSRKLSGYVDRRLVAGGVSDAEGPEYRKWMVYYLDYCGKYGLPPRSTASVNPFLGKLESRGQSAASRDQAGKAVSLLMAGSREAVEMGLSGLEGRVQEQEDAMPAMRDGSFLTGRELGVRQSFIT